MDDPQRAFQYQLAASVWNHAFFWQSMRDGGEAGISEEVQKVLNLHFGSVERFRRQWMEKAAAQFGGGWLWLISRGQHLEIVATRDSETVLTLRECEPLLVMDNWEHAYYFDYDSKRAYARNFLDAVSWDFVLHNLEATRQPSKKWSFARQYKPWSQVSEKLEDMLVDLPDMSGPSLPSNYLDTPEGSSTLYDTMTSSIGSMGRRS